MDLAQQAQPWPRRPSAHLPSACAVVLWRLCRASIMPPFTGASSGQKLSSSKLVSEPALDVRRSFVQPWNADNPPLRSGLSTFLFLFGVSFIVGLFAGT